MPSVPFNEQHDVTDVAVNGDTAHVDLHYPGLEDKVRYLHVGLIDVRAADGIRVGYDYERDGWVVCQPRRRLVATAKDSYADEVTWVEVGFFQAWAHDPWKDTDDGQPSRADYEAADAELHERHRP